MDKIHIRWSEVSVTLESVREKFYCIRLVLPAIFGLLLPALTFTLEESQWRKSVGLRDQADGFGRRAFGNSRDRLLLRRQNAFSRVPTDLQRSLSGGLVGCVPFGCVPFGCIRIMGIMLNVSIM